MKAKKTKGKEKVVTNIDQLKGLNLETKASLIAEAILEGKPLKI
jgi:hypothetical protein